MAVALVAFNNLRPELDDVGYVVVNLAVGFLLVLAAVLLLGSNPAELGLIRSRPGIVLAAGVVAVVLALPLFGLALFERIAHLVADDRVASLSASEVAFYVLVRIPVGTALFEELAFRGVLFGLMSRWGIAFGAIASSIAFGLWHIRPAYELVLINSPATGRVNAGLFVFAAVLITTLAGLAFSWLRMMGRGIWAPVAFHAGINSLALLAAIVAHANIPTSPAP